MKPAYFNEVTVDSHTTTDGLRVDHPRLKEYILNGIKLGWGNEKIVYTINTDKKFMDATISLVTKIRHQYQKELKDK